MPALAACSSGTGGGDDNEVEVFSWWTGPGEEEGLAAMVADFEKNFPGIKFNNAAVSGGAGSNAKAILASRLQSNDPPDSYQRHAGLELADDIKAGKVEELNSFFDEQGLNEALPKGLIDAITIEGKVYAVPVNIHRSNLLWYNIKAMRDSGITAPPTTWAEFLSQAATIKGKGKTPLTIGPSWTQQQLLENVLLGELGAEAYTGLWNGSTDWSDAKTVAALNVFKQVIGMANISSAAADWQPALDPVVDGAAVYNLMGDWANTYLADTKKLGYKTDYDVVTSPGSAGIYNFLSDSFTLPVGAQHPESAKKWLTTCGSVSGQDAFNPKKGSIPARKDTDQSLYKDYLATALKDWQDPNIKIVGSMAHGAVANAAWLAEIDTALGLFVKDGDVNKFATTVKTKYDETK